MAKKKSGSGIPRPKSGSGKKASRTGKKSSSARRSRAAKIAHAKQDLQRLGTKLGMMGVPVALASGASAYLGPKIKVQALGPLGDMRLLLGGAGVLASSVAKLGSWRPLVENVSLGVLTSWMAEEAFGIGMRHSQAAPAATAPVPGAAQSEGLVVGNIFDGVGDAEKRLEKKLARIKKRAAKKGVEWKDVREGAKDHAEKKGWEIEPVRAAPAVVPARRLVGPPAYFRGPRFGSPGYAAWAARHPRLAAVRARRR